MEEKSKRERERERRLRTLRRNTIPRRIFTLCGRRKEREWELPSVPLLQSFAQFCLHRELYLDEDEGAVAKGKSEERRSEEETERERESDLDEKAGKDRAGARNETPRRPAFWTATRRPGIDIRLGSSARARTPRLI